MFANSAPEAICVLRLSAIGDTCHALAVIRNLQDNWPDARITWVIGKAEATLMGDIRDIEFITFDKGKGLSAYREVSRRLSGQSFDVALCMHASMRANLLCRTFPAAVRLGFDKARARDFQWLFTNQRIPAAKGEHALEAMMGFARHIGAQPTEPRWDIPVGDPDRAFAQQYSGARTVVISPCSSQRSRNFRNWPVEHFVSVTRYLRERLQANVVLTGGTSPLEKEYARVIADQSGATDLVGQTSLKQLFALIAAADVVICPDSGPAHMATAAGTPVIGLYATSNPDRTGPYLSRDLCVNRYPDAVERYLGKRVADVRWGRRVRHPEAMELITISDVTRKIDDFFRI
ncbi:MAG: glycosyltransferase family 9 protein [Gammaproteobacteria bacterium]|nr:glycosyltransferase family 9 protein [Gammaproteobacteria bacterium]MDH3953367.1 glycosyltransferase family 9 protein [Gammaproteobacteria bacterium]